MKKYVRKGEDFVLRTFHKAIDSDLQEGNLTEKQAVRLRSKLEQKREYIDMQMSLFGIKLLNISFIKPPTIVGLGVDNIIIETHARFGKHIDTKFMHSPIMTLNRLTPGWSSFAGMIALVYSDRDIMNLIVRYSERVYGGHFALKPLLPIVKIANKALCKLAELKWSDLGIKNNDQKK